MTKPTPLIQTLIILLTLFLAGGTLFAQEAAESALDTGDTAWMMTSTALVLLMTLPGLALFYGGLVRAKNVLSILMQCFVVAAVMSILWVVYGYSLAAGDSCPYFGDFSMLMLNHMQESTLAGTIPESVWVTFQMTFVIITPALMVGAFAERMKFSAVLIFSIIWTTLSYLPIWHMAWGGGLFHDWGVIDFAGGTVVHINAGVAGLVACIFVGKRKGYGSSELHPHNVPFVLIGASLLWVGWFGFNAGSAGGANESAGMAMIVTQVATAVAVLVWIALEWILLKKPTAVGAATGAVAGLVAITPASGTTDITGALVIGAISSLLCYFCATKLKSALKYDDSLDVFGVHGIGGIVGAILTGVFIREGAEATAGIAQTFAQFKSVVVTIIWSGVAATIALFIAKFTVGLRVQETSEEEGLDSSAHGESGYTL
ncbi:MAG: ammonium transporter [Verrucomicrobiales bacterium]|nr:ammonium transporter [Verrucomicrobiales bacterium]